MSTQTTTRRIRKSRTEQDGWVSFLRVLARNSGLKFKVGPNIGAATDGKTVYLPSLPANLNEQDLLLFKSNGYHEVGHCLHSDLGFFQSFSQANGQFAQILLNAVDDCFMEHRMCRTSRVAERYFRECTTLLVERNQFRDGSRSPAEAVACYVLTFLFSRAWHEYLPPLEMVKVNLKAHFGEHYDELVENLNKILISEFPNVRSTVDGGALVLRIIEMLKQQAQEQDKKDEDEQEPEDCQDPSDDESEEGEGEDEGDGSNDDESQEEEGGSATDGDESSDDDSSQPDGDDGEEKVPAKTLSQLVDEMINDDDVGTGEIFDRSQAIKELAEAINNGEVPEYEDQGDVPAFEVDGKPVDQQRLQAGAECELVEGMKVCPADKENAKALEGQLTNKVSVLATKLQALLLNREESDVYASHRGRLGESNLYRVGMGSGKVFEQAEEVVTVSAAVSVVADLSGSTQASVAHFKLQQGIKPEPEDYLTIAESIQQSLLILEKVLNQLGTPREIIGFAPSSGHLTTVVRTFADDHGSAVSRIGGLKQLVGGGWTPIGEAVFQSAQRLHSYPATRKVMFVMTDGEPSSVDMALEQTAAAQRSGIQVVYLLIGNQVTSDWLVEAGIPFAWAKTADELCPVLLDQAEKLLM